MGLLFLIYGVVLCLGIISAMRNGICFCHVFVILATMLMSVEIWRWLDD